MTIRLREDIVDALSRLKDKKIMEGEDVSTSGLVGRAVLMLLAEERIHLEPRSRKPSAKRPRKQAGAA
ncbi:MAG TPA: hypothetical protein VIX19_11535 [Terriglobales bacterium]